ncbi:putative RNA exonuclease NEF-sp [Hypsibius exemplaris]|uniref:RNA exonuclease NEF-sp n=1 Tax=Hypsibius exemplaris TaxID=2072580 RepID=A0A9X6RLD1_HYPEX|nr:putative RNA exonuclease NEF-sp [Hypsibius exemplaris]
MRLENPISTMESTSRKSAREENKAKKLKAFFALTSATANAAEGEPATRDITSPDSGIESETPSANGYLPPNELESLRARLRAQQKEKLSRPLLFQTLPTELLQLSNVRQLLLYALVGGDAPGLKPEWCTLVRWQKITQVVVVAINGLTREDWDAYSTQTSPALKNFLDIGGPLEPIEEGCLARNLLEPSVNRSLKKLKMNGPQVSAVSLLGDYVPPVRTASSSSPDGFSRLHLLMSVERMGIEKYPLPHCTIGNVDKKHFVATQDVYRPVVATSRLFAVDCEMCKTVTGKNELTRISIVNEQLEVVYDTFVKPFNPILDYLTQWSGITKAILDPVKTRLHDVQAAVRKILPADAILCGQSLNGDLDALEMVHPYVIDTSVIFNLSGRPRAKSSLKILSQFFLNKSIQGTDRFGHDSIEDSRTTMELVLLKLRHGITFGDCTMGWELPVAKAAESLVPDASALRSALLPAALAADALAAEKEAGQSSSLKRKLEDVAEVEAPRVPPLLAMSFSSSHQKSGVLNCATITEGKTALVVGSSEYVRGLAEKGGKATVQCVSSAKRVMKRVSQNLLNHEFVFADLKVPAGNSPADSTDRTTEISSLMGKIFRLFGGANDRALCMLVSSVCRVQCAVFSGQWAYVGQQDSNPIASATAAIIYNAEAAQIPPLLGDIAEFYLVSISGSRDVPSAVATARSPQGSAAVVKRVFRVRSNTRKTSSLSRWRKWPVIMTGSAIEQFSLMYLESIKQLHHVENNDTICEVAFWELQRDTFLKTRDEAELLLALLFAEGFIKINVPCKPRDVTEHIGCAVGGFPTAPEDRKSACCEVM